MCENSLMREVRLAVIVAIGTICVLAGISMVMRGETEHSAGGLLSVTFLDVGQGDATLIETPDEIQILIDGGRDMRVLSPLTRELGFFDKTLDVLIATHPDADHIGGLIEVLSRYEVGRIVLTENVQDTPVYESFMDAVSKEGSELIYVRAGHIFTLGGGGVYATTTLTILSPTHNSRDMESNTSSIVAQLRYGTTDFLLTADAPDEIEEYLVAVYGNTLQSDVLKIGHHGSRTSSSEVFLRTVSPQYAIISYGADNSYGHPHREVIERIALLAIPTYNTVDNGSVHVWSDGREVWIE